MAASFSGISSYQQNSQIWKSSQTDKNNQITNNKNNTDSVKNNTSEGLKVSEWKPISTTSPLVPAAKDGYGIAIGDVELSDKAKEYYDKLKSKYHGMDFILVSKDMKSQVASRASAYGNANKPVVLIDDEKIERMANDEAFRKKYEGIIAMSQSKLLEAKNSLSSSGANIKNFGMSIGADGRASFFATVEKANAEQTKALAKRQAAKKEAKAKEKKKAEKETREARLEKRREENKAKKLDPSSKNEKNVDEDIDTQEYVEFKADSVEALIDSVSKYAFNYSMKNVMTEAESKLGQKFDFKG